MKKQKEYNLKGLTTYKSVFSLLQIVAVTIIIVLGLLVGFVFYSSQKIIRKQQNSIYIMDKTGSVSTGNRIEQTPATRLFEYKDQVTKFFHLWYELDASSFDENINLGLNLMGKSGKILYTQYLDADLKKNLVTNGIYTKALIDSIKFNTKVIPVQGIVYGKQKKTILQNLQKGKKNQVAVLGVFAVAVLIIKKVLEIRKIKRLVLIFPDWKMKKLRKNQRLSLKIIIIQGKELVPDLLR